MLQECVNNIWFHLQLYLILIASVSIMRHDIKEIADYCCSEEIVNKGSFIPCPQQVVHKHHQNLAWQKSETECHLKMKLCTDSYFYKTLCPKINWNLDRVLLNEKLALLSLELLINCLNETQVFQISFALLQFLIHPLCRRKLKNASKTF